MDSKTGLATSHNVHLYMFKSVSSRVAGCSLYNFTVLYILLSFFFVSSIHTPHTHTAIRFHWLYRPTPLDVDQAFHAWQQVSIPIVLSTCDLLIYGRSHCFPVASMRPPPETEVVL